MAQSLVNKRLNIATNAVTHATALWNAMDALSDLSLERAQSGNFEESDFDGTDLTHLTPFMIGTLLDNVVPAIKTFVEADGRRDVLLQVRR